MLNRSVVCFSSRSERSWHSKESRIGNWSGNWTRCLSFERIFFFFFEDFFLHWNIFLTLNVCLLNGILNALKERRCWKGYLDFKRKINYLKQNLFSMWIFKLLVKSSSCSSQKRWLFLFILDIIIVLIELIKMKKIR